MSGAPTAADRRIVFLDIDGTYADHGAVPAAHRQAVRAARERGHVVLLCTGRPEVLIPQDAWADVDGAVSSAGARVRIGREVIEDRRYPGELAARALEVLTRHGTRFSLEAPDRVHPSQEGTDLRGVEFAKITVSDTATPVEVLAREIGPGVRALPNSVDVGARRSGELQLADVDKADGIRTVIARLGFTLQQVVGAGDGMNDVGMLEIAGTAVAIEGSPAPLLDLADLVVPGPERAGLVTAFGTLGLI